MAQQSEAVERLKGHALWKGGFGGSACNEDGFDYADGAGAGYAFCECDARSELLPDEPSRKRWHRKHQTEVKRLNYERLIREGNERKARESGPLRTKAKDRQR